MGTNKHQTLRLVQMKHGVRAHDLVRQFGYSPATARSYLSYLKRQDLLARTGQGHILTERGGARLQYFDVAGCDALDCPLCDKKTGYFTCPRCAFQLPASDARIWPDRDFLVVMRHAGVYCPRCLKLLFSESRALLLGIQREA